MPGWSCAAGSRGRAEAEEQEAEKVAPGVGAGPGNRSRVSESGRAVSNAGPGGGRSGGPQRADGLENSRRAEGLTVSGAGAKQRPG